MNNTHEDGPELMQTRWVLSYLRGPLTRDQIMVLMDPLRDESAAASAEQESGARAGAAHVKAASSSQPALPPGIKAYFIPVRGTPAGKSLVYQPKVIGAAKITFSNSKAKLNATQDRVFLSQITDGAVPVMWEQAEEIEVPVNDLEKSAQNGGQFNELPPAASQAKNYSAWDKDLGKWIYGSQTMDLLRSPSLKEVSQPGEGESDFRIRLQQVAREKRDEEVEKLRKKYAPKISRMQERLRKAQATVEKQEEQARQAKLQTALSVGATLLGAFTGRKTFSRTNINKATSAARRAGRAIEESGDVSRASDTVESVRQQLAELEAEFENESAALEEKIDALTETLETVSVKARKSDIHVQLVSLAWAPYWQDEDGEVSPAW